MSNPNQIDITAAILAEQILLGCKDSESKLRKLISTVMIGQDVHDHIRSTLGEARYKLVA